jgi:hypothetical protein
MTNPTGQQDPHAAYSQLDQSQLSNIAREFIQHFQGKSDPQAQQLAQVDPNTATPQQVAQMHEYAAKQHPSVLQDVMNHPILTGMLTAFAAHELKKHFGEHR